MPAARRQDALQPLVMRVMGQFLIEELEIIADTDTQRRWIVKIRTSGTIRVKSVEPRLVWLFRSQTRQEPVVVRFAPANAVAPLVKGQTRHQDEIERW